MPIATKNTGDNLTAAEFNTLDDAVDAATAALTLTAGQRLLGRASAGMVQHLTMAEALEFLSSTRGAIALRGASGWSVLTPGTAGFVLTSNGAGADPTWAAAPSGGGGGGPETNAWALPAVLTNPGSIAATGLTGASVVRVTGIDAAKTLVAPAGTFPAGRVWILYQIGAAAGGPFTITPGAGVTHDGIGIAPTFSVPASGFINIAIYTDDQGATWKFSGDYDFAANKAAVLAALGIGTLKAIFTIPSPADGTKILLRENVSIGAIAAVLAWTDQGSATVNLQIADKTGATNYAVTGAASITGLGALAVTTTPVRTAATGGNTMAKTGNTDRVLQAVLSGTTGAPAELVLEVEYTP